MYLTYTYYNLTTYVEILRLRKFYLKKIQLQGKRKVLNEKKLSCYPISKLEKSIRNHLRLLTVWQFSNFSATHILRENNFSDFRNSKNAILDSFIGSEV